MTMTTQKTTRVKLEATVKYLKWLQADIWEEKGERLYTTKMNPHLKISREVMVYKERRCLTPIEWETIIQAAKEHHLACVVASSDFGFRFSLSIYEAPEWPIAPGAPVSESKPILVLTWEHLPTSIRKAEKTEEKIYDNPCKVYWDFFKKLFDTPLNHELLEDYNLPKIERMDYYSY